MCLVEHKMNLVLLGNSNMEFIVLLISQSLIFEIYFPLLRFRRPKTTSQQRTVNESSSKLKSLNKSPGSL